jgi:hypothetical protein
MIKTINGFENYSISENGEIFSLYEKGKRGKTGLISRLMKTSIGTTGYETVHLYRSGKRFTIMVHRIMAETFLSSIDGKNVVNHKDLNKKNNVISNLEWVTHAENYSHANLNNVMKKPPVIRLLTDEQVLSIRTFNNPKMDKVFAESYGVDKSSICRVRNYKSYRWPTL